MFHTILLSCLFKISNERSPSAIYHLLTGKKSAQTISDAKAYGLTDYFGIYSTLDRKSFDRELNILEQQGHIQNHSDYMLITQKGKSFLETVLEVNKDIHYFNGYYFHQMAPVFWRRLLLFIQTGSNMLKGKKDFVPIVDQESVTTWVRRLYHRNQDQLDILFKNLYLELHELLSLQSTRTAGVTVMRMSGLDKIGQSKKQIADQLQISVHDVELFIQVSIHYILFKVREGNGEYPVLQSFIPDEYTASPLTTSAQNTFMFFQNGLTLEEISQRRNLKLNTIHDHIIEIAGLMRDFPIRKFVSEELEYKILETINRTKTNRLKQIKEGLPEEIGYFSIRLVLARFYLEQEKLRKRTKDEG
jgi:uncharacterized protein YpbB